MERFYYTYLLVISVLGVFLAVVLFLGIKDANQELAQARFLAKMEQLHAAYAREVMSTLESGQPIDAARLNLRLPDSTSGDALSASMLALELSLLLVESEVQLLQVAPPEGDMLAESPTYRNLMALGQERQLLMSATPTQGYLQSLYSKTSYWLLYGGWLFIFAFLMFLVLQGRSIRTIQQVAQRRGEALREANKKLEQLSLTDALTGLVNRRGFDQTLDVEWHRCIRERGAISLLIADVDYFKAFNDTYGHLAGDQCLTSVGMALGQVPFRLGDRVARYGGEEFALILPSTREGADVVAERCRQTVQALAIKHEKGVEAAGVVTVSVGVATMFPYQGGRPLDLIRAADKALYRAKSSGRNQIAKARQEDFVSESESQSAPSVKPVASGEGKLSKV